MSERSLVVLAGCVLAGAAMARPLPVALVAVAVVAALSLRRPILVCISLGLLASLLGARAVDGVGSVRSPEPVSAVARLVGDPRPGAHDWRVELRLPDGRRVRGNVPVGAAPDIRTWRMGERVAVVGSLAPLEASTAWMRSRHLAGRIRIREVRRVDDGGPAWRAVNSLQRLTESGLSSLDPAERALYLGVVFGDDRDQDPLQQYRFRAAGIAHLLAVSGQNVALVLTIASPLVGRLTRTPRVAAAVGIVAWFAAVCRFEPSVLRAAAMVGIGQLAWWHGRYASPRRILWLAVVALVLVDPMLVWSVGFRLSIAACVGLCEFTAPLEGALPGPRWLRRPLAVALAAQALPAVIGVAVFGPTGAMAPLVNLAAVPVGGALMVWGVATGPLAGRVGPPLEGPATFVARMMLGVLDRVAAIGSHPALPTVGIVGAVALAVLVSMPRLSEGSVAVAVRRRRIARVAAVVLVGDLLVGLGVVPRFGPPPTGPNLVAAAAGVERWAVGDAEVWVLNRGATDGRALDLLDGARRPRIDVLVVAGGGLPVSGVARTLRRVVEPRAILAADPTKVRDAVPIPDGTVLLGGVEVTFDVDGRPVRPARPGGGSGPLGSGA